MPIPETTDVGELIRFFKKDKPDASHNQVVAIAINVAKKNREKLKKEEEKKASVRIVDTDKDDDSPQTGPEAIAYALSKLDMEQVKKEAKDTIKEGKKTKRPAAVALLRIAEGLERNGLTPEDYMITAVPVIPPKFRPFSAMGGSFIPGDANVLYKDLWDLMEVHNEEKSIFGDAHSGQSRLDLYDAVRSVYGYGDAVKPKTKAKDIKGFLSVLTGKTAKHSFFQRKMLSKNQDSTGRSTIVVDPDYGIDDIGIPEAIAFKMYAPYIQRRLRMSGMSDIDALKHTKDRDEHAKRALEKEMEVRPVVYSRAPAWHKFSVLAGKPRLTEGNAIAINPFVTTGMNADFDGDTINVHVPASPSAVKEAQEKLMPSTFPFSNRDTDKLVPLPKQEQILGLYTAATSPKTTPIDFPSEQEAIAAIKSGKIPLSADITIKGKG
jgi:DNA-directed RNA polymerase subunit beta'